MKTSKAHFISTSTSPEQQAASIRGYGSIHGLRTPNEAFFHWNLELLGLDRQIWQLNFLPFGVFSAKLPAPILVQRDPCPCIFINPSIYNISCWVAWTMGQTNRWPSVLCSKHFFFHDFLQNSLQKSCQFIFIFFL